MVGSLWPTVHKLHGTLILDEGFQCGDSMSSMSLAPFRMKNISPNFPFPAAGVSPDLGSSATVLPCHISPYRQSLRPSVRGKGHGSKDSLSTAKRRMSCEQSNSVREKWLAL